MKIYTFRKNLILFMVAISGISQIFSQPTNQLRVSPADSLRIEALITQMTLEEKIGQLSLFTSDWDKTGPSLNENYKTLIREGRAGAIFNAYTVDFIRGLQGIAIEESRLKIPLIFGYDVIHGHRTIFPVPLGMAASWDLAGIEEAARIAAREATAEGLNW